MCGIAGLISWDHDRNELLHVAKRMTSTLTHRGPDAFNIWSSEHVSLGHSRLAIIDIAGGSQPLVVTDSSGNETALVFNGEIYNFKELRSDLISRGYQFRTHSDTEVVLHSYLEWGPLCVTRFRGMFAFALWDGYQRQLLLARDRLGIKPLFFSLTDDGVVFGSEPKALLAHPDIAAAVDGDGLAELFTMAPTSTPGHAIYSTMEELLPAHIMLINVGGVRQHEYWRLENQPHEDDEETTIARVRRLLTDAVTEHLVADVSISSLLSGGLDSSAVSALANLHHRQVLSTFAVDPSRGFTEQLASGAHSSYDTPYAELVARHIDSIHKTVPLTTEELLTAQESALRARDVPGFSIMDTSLFLLFAAIAPFAPVALSGEAADELFAGYRWHDDQTHWRKNSFPWTFGIGTCIPLLNAEASAQLRPDRYLAERYAAARAGVPLSAGETRLERERRVATYLTITHFLRFLLQRSDRMSMASSVEVRVPFCDHRLVEYTWNIPTEMKNMDGIEKGLLRRAVAHVLPHEVTWRRKSSYPAARTRKYQRALWSAMRDTLADRQAPLWQFVDPIKVTTLLNANTTILADWNTMVSVSYLLEMNAWFADYGIQVR